jgi:hypothetical protein
MIIVMMMMMIMKKKMIMMIIQIPIKKMVTITIISTVHTRSEEERTTRIFITPETWSLKHIVAHTISESFSTAPNNIENTNKQNAHELHPSPGCKHAEPYRIYPYCETHATQKLDTSEQTTSMPHDAHVAVKPKNVHLHPSRAAQNCLMFRSESFAEIAT